MLPENLIFPLLYNTVLPLWTSIVHCRFHKTPSVELILNQPTLR